MLQCRETVRQNGWFYGGWHWVEISDAAKTTHCTVVNCAQSGLAQGDPLVLCGPLMLLMFQFLLRVQGFVQASLVAQFCLQDELHLDVFTYRTYLLV